MMTEKILACPYCGGEDARVFTVTVGERFYVGCPCSASGPISKNESDAISLWNAAANALSKKDAEIARLTAALAETEEQRHETVSKLSLALIREAASNKRQDELEAEIALLERNLIETSDRAMIAEVRMDKITRDYNNERNRANKLESEFELLRYELSGRKLEIKEVLASEAESIRLFNIAADKLDDEENKNCYLDHCVTSLQEYAEKVEAERDEARRVARRYYNAANAWMKNWTELINALPARNEPQSVRVTETSDSDGS